MWTIIFTKIISLKRFYFVPNLSYPFKRGLVSIIKSPNPKPESRKIRISNVDLIMNTGDEDTFCFVLGYLVKNHNGGFKG